MKEWTRGRSRREGKKWCVAKQGDWKRSEEGKGEVKNGVKGRGTGEE